MNKAELTGRLTRDAEVRYGGQQDTATATDANGFMNIPDGIDDELPFN